MRSYMMLALVTSGNLQAASSNSGRGCGIVRDEKLVAVMKCTHKTEIEPSTPVGGCVRGRGGWEMA